MSDIAADEMLDVPDFPGECEAEPWAITKALAESDASYSRALAVCCGDQNEHAVTLIERTQIIDGGLIDLGRALDELIAKHPGDKTYAERCESALRARMDIAKLEKQTLLSDWYAGREFH